MAYFFKICQTFFRKNVAQKFQVEKKDLRAKNSEDFLKSRVTSDYVLPSKFDCNVSNSPGKIPGSQALQILSIQVRLGKN